MTEEHTLYFLIGASGSGKTTVAKLLEKARPDLVICYFDRIGVPSVEIMVKEFGSPDEWQRIKTIEWAQRIKSEFLSDKDVMLDAQTRPAFINDACNKAHVESYKIILFDCNDNARVERLGMRGQPELAHRDMLNWAKYLREACASGVCTIVDNSDQTAGESLDVLKTVIVAA